MFEDIRSKRLIVTAHCLLNQNSKADGTAGLPSQFEEAIGLIMAERVGIIQLPCPELLCLGLDRGDKDGGRRDVLDENTRIRRLMNQRENLEVLRAKGRELVGQLRQYRQYDFQIIGLIGVNRSPSCGIDTTSERGLEVSGRGVFMEIIEEELKQSEFGIKMIGIKTSGKEEALGRIKDLLASTLTNDHFDDIV